MVKWFDVKEELPPVEEKVLVHIKGDVLTAVYESGDVWSIQSRYDTDGEAYALGLISECDTKPNPWIINRGWYEIDRCKQLYFIDPKLDGEVTHWMYISDLYFNKGCE